MKVCLQSLKCKWKLFFHRKEIDNACKVRNKAQITIPVFEN